MIASLEYYVLLVGAVLVMSQCALTSGHISDGHVIVQY